MTADIGSARSLMIGASETSRQKSSHTWKSLLLRPTTDAPLKTEMDLAGPPTPHPTSRTCSPDARCSRQRRRTYSTCAEELERQRRSAGAFFRALSPGFRPSLSARRCSWRDMDSFKLSPCEAAKRPCQEESDQPRHDATRRDGRMCSSYVTEDLVAPTRAGQRNRLEGAKCTRSEDCTRVVHLRRMTLSLSPDLQAMGKMEGLPPAPLVKRRGQIVIPTRRLPRADLRSERRHNGFCVYGRLPAITRPANDAHLFTTSV